MSTAEQTVTEGVMRNVTVRWNHTVFPGAFETGLGKVRAGHRGGTGNQTASQSTGTGDAWGGDYTSHEIWREGT